MTSQEQKELMKLAKDVKEFLDGESDDKRDARFSINRIIKILARKPFGEK
jgi:hypothetical protein